MSNSEVQTSETMEPEAALAVIAHENLAVYRESPSRLQEDVSQESQVAHDYRGRLVYELLQNADDALLDIQTTDDRALFHLTDDELWVANTGRPFTTADVRGLCGLGASSKAGSQDRKRASIGHKGLGFKSVLEITDAPEAFSDSVCFSLGRVHARPRIEDLWRTNDRGPVRDVPAMRFPAPIDPHPMWEELRALGFHTAFRFPFHSRIQAQHRDALAEQLLTLPTTTVLFLKHLEEVVIEVRLADREDDHQWLVERHRVSGDDARLERCGGLTDSGLYRVDIVGRDDQAHRFLVGHDADVEIGSHRAGLSGPAWEGVDVTEVSVAVPDDGDSELPEDDRRFHVFLPTQEPSAFPLLVNGAFTTDLSRQHIKVSESEGDYNGYLIRRAAEVFRDRLVPHLLSHGGGAGRVLRALGRGDYASGAAADFLHERLTDALRDTPLIPCADGILSMQECVLPSPILGERGAEFAQLIDPQSTHQGRRFPEAEFCAGELAAIAAQHGAVALTPADTLVVLANCADPSASVLRPEPRQRFMIDPVLDLCAALWEGAAAIDRHDLESVAPLHRVYPVGQHPDGTVHRIAVGDDNAFYPPAATEGDLPLRRLQFLAHSVCWGTLGRTEQRSVLEAQMRAWSALFSIKEFRFEEVMRAAVLPGLTRTGTPDRELREANRSVEALATICRLAGKTTKPDQPLPLGRLGSDRAFFNLSRLEVPCRAPDGEESWQPAFTVYFGRDWVGDDSVEALADAAAEAGQDLGIHFLAPPSAFEEYASTLGVHSEDDAAEADAPIVDDGEVDIEDDTDQVLETTAADRWRNFFAWLGVSQGLRLVHFHDVNDPATGWTTTKDLVRPGGWAFQHLDGVWDDYRTHLNQQIAHHPLVGSTDHYLYEIHDLDKITEITALAGLADNKVAERLLEHLVRNWSSYAPRTRAELALVGSGKWPSSRTAPPRATAEERHATAVDLWLFRLRHHAICPTTQGPRRPEQTWRRSEELIRRFDKGGRKSVDLLPVLALNNDLPASALRSCLDELRVRAELTPTSFSIDDAHDLCERLKTLYNDRLTDSVLRREVRPIYRELFELLSGTSSQAHAGVLAEAPLAARTAAGHTFLPAKDVIYASVAGSRERSGIQDKLPLFVLEAEPGATAPLRSLFAAPVLEDSLQWAPHPGEPAFTGPDLQLFRSGLIDLVPPLLARLSADRPERSTTDKKLLVEFARRVEPVDELALTCAFRGEDLGTLPHRNYFVRRTSGNQDFQGFIRWIGPAWPPLSEDAQSLAMALADALGVNTVETFLSFISADESVRRQLLDLAGASDFLNAVERELNDPGRDDEREPEPDQSDANAAVTDGESTERHVDAPTTVPADIAPAAPIVPLRRFEDLLFDGQVIVVQGLGSDQTSEGENSKGQTFGKPGSQPGQTPPRAAAGMDLDSLDRLGMQITIAFEKRRLDGRKVVVLPGDEDPASAGALIVDVSSPRMIAAAEEQSKHVTHVFDHLATLGISRLYPGFDILTIVGSEADRMIELKSSGVDAQIQAMSWNEWKTAKGELRQRFWLYLVGNLRADLQHALPFVRAVRDPFGTLASATSEDVIRRRSVQLRIREFAAADEMVLQLRASEED